MLSKVEVITTQGTKLVLSLIDIGNGYVIKDIGGLDPVTATIVSSSFAQKDGTQYQSSRREARNITLKLGLDPRGVPRELRKQLYSFLMPKSEVVLRFSMDEEDGEVPVVIYGRVESFESQFFTKEPEVDISIMCFDPDFIVPEPTVLTEYADWDGTPMPIEYEGSVETGIQFRLEVNRNLSSFTIENTPGDGIPRVLTFTYPGVSLIAGDVLDISTVTGNKYVLRTRNGLTESILYAVTPYSDWVNFYPGLNEFRFNVDYVSGYLPMAYRIEYTTRVGGL